VLDPSGELVICNCARESDHSFIVYDKDGNDRRIGAPGFFSTYQNAPGAAGKVLPSPAIVWMTDDKTLFSAGSILDVSRGAAGQKPIYDTIAICQFDFESGELLHYGEVDLTDSSTVNKTSIEFSQWKAFAKPGGPSTLYGHYTDPKGTKRMFVVELDSHGYSIGPGHLNVRRESPESLNSVSEADSEFRFFERRDQIVWMGHVVWKSDELLYTEQPAVYK
jgi:hypothetical protein